MARSGALEADVIIEYKQVWRRINGQQTLVNVQTVTSTDLSSAEGTHEDDLRLEGHKCPLCLETMRNFVDTSGTRIWWKRRHEDDGETRIIKPNGHRVSTWVGAEVIIIIELYRYDNS